MPMTVDATVPADRRRAGLRDLGGRRSSPGCTRRRCASTTGSGWSRPGRTAGGGRRYSPRDIELLREVQRLSQDDGRQPGRASSGSSSWRTRSTRCSSGSRELQAELDGRTRGRSGRRTAAASVWRPAARRRESIGADLRPADHRETHETAERSMDTNKLTTQEPGGARRRVTRAPPAAATRTSSRRTCCSRCSTRTRRHRRPLLRGGRRRPRRGRADDAEQAARPAAARQRRDGVARRSSPARSQRVLRRGREQAERAGRRVRLDRAPAGRPGRRRAARWPSCCAGTAPPPDALLDGVRRGPRLAPG